MIRETKDVISAKSCNWSWVQKGFLKKETEGMIFAAQEKALQTNWMKKNVDKKEESLRVKMSHVWGARVGGQTGKYLA